MNNGGANISINALEEMKKVYSIIQKHFPEDMVQFYETVATLFNRAYVQPAPSVSISEELPFGSPWRKTRKLSHGFSDFVH